MQKDMQFSELMCAKFCHDLSGSIGAVNNSIDFLESKNEEMRRKALELVKFSAKQSVDRVSFFRRAYGFASHSADANLTDIKTLTKAFLDDSRFEVIFKEPWDSISVTASFGKLIMNAIIILSGSVMGGGKFEITFNNDNGKVKIRVDAVAVKISSELSMILSGDSGDLEKNARNIQYFYTYELAKTIRYAIDIEESKGMVSLQLSRS
jgi:histidine phosphotransferase ChpT